MTNAHRSAGIVLAAFVLVWAGCGPAMEPPPKVFPVKGVVKKKGGAPLDGGMIEFRLESNPTFAMSSAIAADGTFDLHTLFGAKKLNGAAAGACKVSVYTITDKGELISRETVLPKQLITIEEKANDLTIEVE